MDGNTDRDWTSVSWSREIDIIKRKHFGDGEWHLD
jgi:hypothetical protein